MIAARARSSRSASQQICIVRSALIFPLVWSRHASMSKSSCLLETKARLPSVLSARIAPRNPWPGSTDWLSRQASWKIANRRMTVSSPPSVFDRRRPFSITLAQWDKPWMWVGSSRYCWAIFARKGRSSIIGRGV